MKKGMSKTEAHKKIDEFFERESFISEELKKIRKLAMKFKILLGENRKKFCKKCNAMLKGKTRIKKRYKLVVCGSCGAINRFKLVR